LGLAHSFLSKWRALAGVQGINCTPRQSTTGTLTRISFLPVEAGV
jgi:hypothetical protein